MKILKFIKKNYKRLIIQVVSIISAFVIFSVSASAEPFDISIDMSISKPNISSNTYYVEVLYNDGTSAEVDILSVRGVNSTDNLQYPPVNIQITNDSITFVSHFEGTQYLFNCFWITNVGNNGVYQTEGEFLKISYSNIAGVHLYGNFNVIGGSLPNNVNWNINYSSDASIIAELEKITGILSQQNNNDIVSSIEQSTNEILNGYESKPDVDGSSIDNTISMDNQIIQDNSNGIDSAIDFIEGITLGNVNQGMLAVTNVFDTFVNIPWFNEITRFSLLFGVFAFILGLSIFVISKARKR